MNFIRVIYQTALGGRVVVASTTTAGVLFTTLATLPATFANGDTLTAAVNGSGNVFVWKTSGSVTTYLGATPAAAGFTGTGRIGMLMPNGGAIDNFAGGTVSGLPAVVNALAAQSSSFDFFIPVISH
jgi:hypothetical protein